MYDKGGHIGNYSALYKIIVHCKQIQYLYNERETKIKYMLTPRDFLLMYLKESTVK